MFQPNLNSAKLFADIPIPAITICNSFSHDKWGFLRQVLKVSIALIQYCTKHLGCFKECSKFDQV